MGAENRHSHPEVNGLCVYWMRATAATNAPSHEADIAKVQEWLGHANVSTIPALRPAQEGKPQDSPTFHAGSTNLAWLKLPGFSTSGNSEQDLDGPSGSQEATGPARSAGQRSSMPQ